MGHPYRAPQELPPPPPDVMRRVLIATGVVAMVGAAAVITFGVRDAHHTAAVSSTVPILYADAAALPSVTEAVDTARPEKVELGVDPETQDNKTIVVPSGRTLHVVVEDGPPRGGLRERAPLRPPWRLLTQSTPLGPCEAGRTPGGQSTFDWDGSVTSKVHELVTLELESPLDAGSNRHLTVRIDFSPPVVDPDAGWGNGHSWFGNPRRPHIRQGELTVSAGLPREVVAHVLALGFDRFHDCYDDVVKRDPTVRGSVATRFTINRDGTVQDPIAIGPGTTLPDPRITRCIVHKIAYLRFLEPDRDGVVIAFTLLLDPPPVR